MRKTLIALPLVLGLLPGCIPVVATGVGAGVLMAEDRRTSGTYIEDEAIELKVAGRLREKYGSVAHVNATSYNRTVLLTGEAPTAALKSEIAAMVAAVENVRSVVNEIAVREPTPLSSRSNDAFITSKVKARFVDARRFQANHVKVVTENGVVYLLGLVRRQEADAAADIASRTTDVKKVVKIFEYIQ